MGVCCQTQIMVYYGGSGDRVVYFRMGFWLSVRVPFMITVIIGIVWLLGSLALGVFVGVKTRDMNSMIRRKKLKDEREKLNEKAGNFLGRLSDIFKRLR